jgi:nitroreductase
MDFQQVVRRRRMVRAFTDWPLPPETVARVLANAQRGPSSGFTQGTQFLVFVGPEQTARFWTAMTQGRSPSAALMRPELQCAPLIIVPFAHEQAYVTRYLAADKTAAGRKSGADFPAPYWFIDAGMAAMLVSLTAVDAELAALYFSVGANVHQVPAFRAALGVPEAYYPVGAIAIGYPAADTVSPSPQMRREQRRPPAAVLHHGAW